MSETLLSVGLDVGTTTSQMIVSRLTVENRSSGFAVPELEITGRQILYRSPVYFTPLKGTDLVDGDKLRELVSKEYTAAGISREDVDTGAVIITGETSRKENAKQVLEALSGFAGEFVVATAGPDLESVLAAKGAGAVSCSRETELPVLHIDIGGGTSNLALIRDGKILRTGCFNIGGRLMRFDEAGKQIYLSPVLRGLAGDPESATDLMVQVLEMVAGRRTPDERMKKLETRESETVWLPPEEPVLVSFSGGVADCIEAAKPPDAFGDLGPLLGQKIKKSLLCSGPYRLGNETIRATVIGAGCHSTRLSGSTVFCRGFSLPMQNLPVAVFSSQAQEDAALSRQIADAIKKQDRLTVLAFPGYHAPSYFAVTRLAEKIAKGVGDRPVAVCVETDMAKALGHALCLHLPADTPCLCIDRLPLGEESFLDIGAPVGPAFPVVIKTLVLEQA